MSQQIQIVIALQEAFKNLGWDVRVGASRSMATITPPKGMADQGVMVDLMRLSEAIAEALDR